MCTLQSWAVEPLSLLEKAATLGMRLAAMVQGDRARSKSGVNSTCKGLRRQVARGCRMRAGVQQQCRIRYHVQRTKKERVREIWSAFR